MTPSRVLVTGASRGIGRALAELLAARGLHVAAGYNRSAADAAALQAAFPALIRLSRFDVSDARSVSAAVTAIEAEIGPLDGLVNCAGVGSTQLLIRQAETDVQRIVATNLLGSIFCARAVLPSMLKRRTGTIINVSSVASLRPRPGQAAYAATKGGIDSFTLALAAEYGARGIAARSVQFGPVDTSMLSHLSERERVAMGPMMQATEAAGVIASVLMSAEAHGTVIVSK